LESFALSIVLLALIAGLFPWLAILIWRGVIVHFELFRHRFSPSKSMWDVLAESGEPLFDETANEPTALTAAPH
jgi:hypothetical protein